MDEKNTGDPKKGPAESFSDMMKEFGSSIAEIFNDPELKNKAKDFGDSAAASAKAFAARFKDEDVKNKFKSVGYAAKNFGDSMAGYFKDDKKEGQSSGEDSSADTGNAQDMKNGSESKSSVSAVVESSGSPAADAGENPKAAEPSSTPGTGVRPTDAERKYNIEEKERLARARNSRITGYSFAIAWNIIFFIFFNFFSRYIASYEFIEATNSWNITPFITSSYNLWLPVLNAAIIAAIIGNIILIVNDSFYFDSIVNIFMNLFGIASAAALLLLFPFDFSVFPSVSGFVSNVVPIIVRAVLIVVILGLSISVIVRFIKIIVKASKTS